MTTQAELRTVGRFTFGSATHRVAGYSLATALERSGVGHDVFRRYTYTIETELQGASLADLKTQLDAAKSELITSGVNFTLYRESQIAHQHNAADCHFGPVARVDTAQEAGPFETVTVTVECLVPVSITAGLIDHTFEETSVADDEADIVSVVRTGRVITTAAQSAKDWIEANLPAQPSGYDRRLDIRTDDTDSSATYTLTDAETTRRNMSGTVRDHKYTRTTTTRDGVLEEILHTGSVRMVDGNSARTFIEANLPATTSGFARNYSVSNSDDDLDGSYSVTDTKADWSALPGIDKAQLEESRSVDSQLRVTLERRGYFVGANAQTEVDNVRTALAALGTIVFEEVREDIYNDQRISFRFTALSSDDGETPSGIVFWQEVVRKSGGGRPRIVSVYPDRNPFIYSGAPLPVAISISGRAVSVTGSYVAAPEAPAEIAEYQNSLTDEVLNRVSETERETSWNMTFICPPGTAAPAPRSRPEP